MSDVSKTNEELERLALAAEDAAGGPPSAEQVDALIAYTDALRDALEAAARVPVQGEPGACLDHKPVQHRDGKPPWCNTCGRTTVPDAATDKPDPCEMTHTPPFDFAQCETHDTTFPLGGKCKWHGRTSIVEVLQDEIDEQRARAVRAEHERGEADKARHWFEVTHKNHERAEQAEAERDAALAAVAAVRALHWREPGTGVDWCAHCIDDDGPWPCSTIQALDGAPEPEWEYADSEGDPGPHHLTRFSADLDTLSRRNENRKRLGHEPLPIYRRRKAGPWGRVDGSES